VRLLALLARRLPPRAARGLGRGLGRGAFVLGVRRRVSLDNLERALGREYDAGARRRIAAAAYEHLGTCLMEFLGLPATSAAERRARLDIEGLEHARAALAAGRGAILVSGHYGNWEVASACAAAHGLPLTFVVQPLGNRAVDRLAVEIRTRAGIEVLRRGMALRRVHRTLAANRLVCFMCDQDARRRGAFVPLFGVPASTPKGAAQLALRLQVPFIPGINRRLADGRQRMRFFAPIAPPPGASEEEGVRALLAAFNSLLEAAVREEPSQYWWAHRRWKTEPPPEARETMGEPAPTPGRSSR